MKMKVLPVFLMLALSLEVLAAKPAGISFKETKTNAEGTEYQLYSVKCSNGQQRDISAWNNRKLWCLGTAIEDDQCEKKQIKIAKKACKG